MGRRLAGALIAVLVAACTSAPEHRAAVRDAEAERLTVGKVQREIRVGMSSAEVIGVLGSPNIVATDEERREVWTYDKVSTESVYSESRGGVSALILAAGGGALGGAAPRYEAGAGAKATTQRTLTIVIKFGTDARVRDFAYRASQF